MDKEQLTPAESLLVNLGIETPREIRLQAICTAHGILLKARPLETMEAYIVTRRNGQGHSLITVNSRSSL